MILQHDVPFIATAAAGGSSGSAAPKQVDRRQGESVEPKKILAKGIDRHSPIGFVPKLKPVAGIFWHIAFVLLMVDVMSNETSQ